jgi:hypothetical protein
VTYIFVHDDDEHCPATCQAWPAGREAQLGEGLPAQEAGAATRRLES